MGGDLLDEFLGCGESYKRWVESKTYKGLDEKILLVKPENYEEIFGRCYNIVRGASIEDIVTSAKKKIYLLTDNFVPDFLKVKNYMLFKYLKNSCDLSKGKVCANVIIRKKKGDDGKLEKVLNEGVKDVNNMEIYSFSEEEIKNWEDRFKKNSFLVVRYEGWWKNFWLRDKSGAHVFEENSKKNRVSFIYDVQYLAKRLNEGFDKLIKEKYGDVEKKEPEKGFSLLSSIKSILNKPEKEEIGGRPLIY